MNDVIFEIVCMDLMKYLIAFVVLVCLRVQYLKFKAILMRGGLKAVLIRRGLKGICKIA
jgi:hypothetical protein